MIRIDALYLLLLGEAFLLMAAVAVFLYIKLRRVRAMKQRTRVQEIRTEVVAPAPEQEKEIERMSTELSRLEAVIIEKEAEIGRLQAVPPAPGPSAADAATALQDELLSINMDMPKEEDLASRVRELEALIADKDKELAAAQSRFDSLELEYLALYNEKNAQQ